jgi:hypothetical protein
LISYGRGFVVNYDDHHRIVLTASHCLPFFPPCHRVSYLEERTCKALLAPLGIVTNSPGFALCRFETPCALLSDHLSILFRIRPSPVYKANESCETGYSGDGDQREKAVFRFGGRTTRKR